MHFEASWSRRPRRLSFSAHHGGQATGTRLRAVLPLNWPCELITIKLLICKGFRPDLVDPSLGCHLSSVGRAQLS